MIKLILQTNQTSKSDVAQRFWFDLIRSYSCRWGFFSLFCSSINFNYRIEIGYNISINIYHSVVISRLFQVFVWLCKIDSVAQFDDLVYLNRLDYCILSTQYKLFHSNGPNAKLNAIVDGLDMRAMSNDFCLLINYYFLSWTCDMHTWNIQKQKSVERSVFFRSTRVTVNDQLNDWFSFISIHINKNIIGILDSIRNIFVVVKISFSFTALTCSIWSRAINQVVETEFLN